MKTYLKLTIILLIMVVFTNCKNDPKLSEYKYPEKEFQVNCENIDLDLIKEAVYSFEADITDYFSQKGRESLSQAYPRVVNYGQNSRANFNKIPSPHTQEIFEILKTDTELWNLDGETKSLNYDHELVKCIANNLTDKDLKTTFNALITTNSMSAKLFREPLKRKAYLAVNDIYLATYIALDMYYAKLFDMDFDKEDVKNKPVESENYK